MARDILDAVREDLDLFEQVLPMAYAGKLAISPGLESHERASMEVQERFSESSGAQKQQSPLSSHSLW